MDRCETNSVGEMEPNPAEDDDESISPEDDDESISPEDDDESISPEDDDESISPEDDDESISPEDDDESISPEDDDESISPEDDDESISPEDDDESISPEDDDESISPEDDDESISPEDDDESISPEDDDESISPEDDDESTSPEDDDESTSPEDDDESTSSEDDDESTSRMQILFKLAQDLDDFFRRTTTKQEQSVFKLSKSMEDILSRMTWTDEDVVMQVRCRTGYCTVNGILPKIKKYKIFLAVDERPDVIEYARSIRSSDSLVFYVAKIEDLSTFPREWQGTITKAISIECFRSYKREERLLFQNLFALMAPCGEVLFHFKISSPVRDVCEDVINHPKWKNYINDPSWPMYLSNDLYSDPAGNFRKMLEEIGFVVLVCKEEMEMVIFDDEPLKEMLELSCKFVTIPEEENEEFMDYAFETVLNHHDRNSKGEPLLTYERILLHLVKPER